MLVNLVSLPAKRWREQVVSSSKYWNPHASSHSIGFPMLPPTALDSLCFLPQHWIPCLLPQHWIPCLLPQHWIPCHLPQHWIPYASSHSIGFPMIPPTTLDSICFLPQHWFPYASSHRLDSKLAFAMTINKSQGQTWDKVGIYLSEPGFSHGQLYVLLEGSEFGDVMYVSMSAILLHKDN
jgi:hypothetical protein